jgi:zinc protease
MDHPPGGFVTITIIRAFMARAGLAALGVLALAPIHPVPAQQAPPAGEIQFESYRLENGLRVILAPDDASTAVAVNLWFDVGSRHERPGRSGFAHLFEHLMFEGSENVGRGEHAQYVERAGGNYNASITEDRTNYFQTMPPDRYNLALWLESDRMRALRITEEVMRREVEVVKEERRLRVDNSPYGTSVLQMQAYAPYDSVGCFAYAHSVIGSMEDLDAAELPDVQEFFDMYYAPNNATLAVVGAFDPAEARALIEVYFAGIPAVTQPEPVACDEPFRHLPVRLTVPDGNAQLPAFLASYGGVPAGHEDSYALTLLGSILGAGESSRLHQGLVRREQAAVSASSSTSLRRGPGLFHVIVVANQGVEAERLEALVGEEIARIQREGVTAEELERAKNRYRSSTVTGRQTVMGRAEALQWHNHFLGDPGAIRTEMERIMNVSADDVRRVASRYLTDENRAVIYTQPTAAASGE